MARQPRQSPGLARLSAPHIMPPGFDYATSVARNGGYVSAPTQALIKSTTLMIAGCGIGSSVAVCATRFGFEKFLLVDGDVVDTHNLNRQFYDFDDVGSPKVEALRRQILRINPEARVEAIAHHLDGANVDAIVARADIVFDTVDFLDLSAILALHASARRHGVAILTALSMGFGAGVLCFPAGAPISLNAMISADIAGADPDPGDARDYARVFASIIRRIASHLDTQVVEQIAATLDSMQSGKPCPASQLAVGSFAVAAMAVSLMHDLLAGNSVPCAPEMVVHSFRTHRTLLVDITTPASH
jgi:hypothetical protein